jgi:threonyl-tRNA synthetase
MAQAVQNLFGRDVVQLGIGPAVENGFYYDFKLDHAFTPEDLLKIEKEMRKLIAQNQQFVRREVNIAEARAELANQPFKLELINSKNQDGIVSFYDNVLPNGSTVWTDLCQGPHVPDTSYIKAFKLMRSAGAYWLGKETNPQMQRIYGTAWQSEGDLRAYLLQMEEAEKRDHRRLGIELDLFSFPKEIGSGLPVFHPKGGIVRLEMENYSRKKHLEAGYSFVNTPHITKGQLFETSGHLDWYSEGMFPPMKVDEDIDYYLKPMNCPMHNLVYQSRARSYRELPLRLFEFGTVYRYEKSGVVHGLTRARGFTQDDAHIYCTEDQMKAELSSLLRFVLDLLKDFGLTDFYLELSTKDPHKFVGSDEIWEVATRTLEEVALESQLQLVPDVGGAAFYGPKISVQVRDAIGRTWQISTIQLDFNEPELFKLEYQAADGTRKRPVMIHRALFGSIERFFGILVEHYNGAFPAWLAPVQVKGIPVADEYAPYVNRALNKLAQQGIRVELDVSADRFGKKIRTATQEKVPFVLIAGEQDKIASAVSLRLRNGKQLNGLPLEEAIEYIVSECQAVGSRA